MKGNQWVFLNMIFTKPFNNLFIIQVNTVSNQLGHQFYNYHQLGFSAVFIMKSINLNIEPDTKEFLVKSPLHNTSKSNFKIKFPPSSDIPSLKNFIRAYRKEIELPINFQTSIFLSKSPQRCLQHNNILTLYCVPDKKALCENCMYKTLPHKKHEVIALSNANDILKSDYNAVRKSIDQKIQPIIAQMIKNSQTNQQKIEKDIDQLIGSVTKFYNDLNVLINTKKIQQIKYYKEMKITLKNEYSSLATQFLEVDHYLNDKLKQISERTLDEHIALNHSVLMNLAKLDQIITPQMKRSYPFKFGEVYKKMSEMTVNLTNLFNFNYKILGGQNTSKDRELSPNIKKRTSLQKSKKMELSPQKYNDHRIPNGPRFSPRSIIVQSTFTPRELNQRSSYKQMSPIMFISPQKKDDTSTTSRKKMFQAVKEHKNLTKIIAQKKII